MYGSDGGVIGKVDAVLDNYRENILDGFVIETSAGELRFVDAPEVRRTAERGVTLTISSAEAADLPPPGKGAATFRPSRAAGRVSRMLGRGWRRDR